MSDHEDLVIRLIGETLKLDDEEMDILRDEDTDQRLKKWDSAGHVQIIVALEDGLDIEIDEHTIPRLNNVRKIIDFIKARNLRITNRRSS